MSLPDDPANLKPGLAHSLRRQSQITDPAFGSTCLLSNYRAAGKATLASGKQKTSQTNPPTDSAPYGKPLSMPLRHRLQRRRATA